MKKMMILMLSLFVLTSCTKTSTPVIDVVEEDYKLSTLPVEQYERNTYYLDVNLDTTLDVLTVKGEIIYHNDEMDFSELYLTLYPNAINPRIYENDNCVFKYLKLNGENIGFTLLGEDRTLMQLNLNQTLEKDNNFSVAFEYSFQYWENDRILAMDGYYLTMFFYPYITLYDDFSLQHVPYTFSGESYYNDMGDYYVSINVPQDYKIVSSGRLISEVNKDNRLEQSFYLENGRDFSFSTSNYYREYTRTIEDIDYKIVSIRELSNQEIATSFNILADAFDLFENAIGDYYYDYFTLEYGHFYGMESSGIIYCSSNISEGTVVHEIIHQWFYSMIGNNQAVDSFLDESLTTFISGTYYYYMYGDAAANDYYSYRSSDNSRFDDYYNASLGVSLIREVDDLQPYYAFLIYYHGVSIFKEYVDVYLNGDYDMFLDLMKQYYTDYNGKTVTIDAFLNSLEEYSNIDGTYEWFMTQITSMQDLRDN
ncbi:MAG: hypothetical protein JXR62_06510 [Bacilli bacterium]|nr:hypothetical protein [Bacilli bacterium]